MRIADRLSRIKPSATLAVSAKAMELKAQGRKIVSLSVGEPDFQTPEHIRTAAKEAIDAGFTRYTQVPGIPELRQAVAGYFERFYGVAALPENVIVTNGGKQSLFNLLQAVAEPGDQVLLPGPWWVSYPAMVQLAEAEPVTVPCSAAQGFKITPEDLERARTGRTRILILNTPSNPTGAHYTPAELDALAAWAVDNDVFVISDEIYDRLVYEPAVPASLSPWWQRHPERFAVVNGLSKTFAMTGWRVGYTLGHPDLIKAMSKIQGQSTSNVCSIAQKAALAALTGPMDVVERMLLAFRRRRDLALQVISTWKDAVCPVPDGAFYVFPDLSAFKSDRLPSSTAMCTALLEEAGVAAVPGIAFGDDNCVRFSYAVGDEELVAALELAGKVLMAGSRHRP
jgi:aspartate aminotransferase